ncbi:MAG: zinc ribbon domain-containing protein [Microcystis sp. LE19-55.1A]|nr:zinc ribbon domain-containing protein [Microcystis sp. LE19-55.1A]MCZ8201087.1 zinc ribbon domain-containing protein [Microcystis sp. LE19-55.1A]MCZ8308545.1 zinc ribbon domain-containing protein [Microcystis sp. LE19-98.1E]
MAVNPAYTSQECLNCGRLIKKSLSVRTHVCLCGYMEDRDKMAALNILKKATIGHIGNWHLDLRSVRLALGERSRTERLGRFKLYLGW